MQLAKSTLKHKLARTWLETDLSTFSRTLCLAHTCCSALPGCRPNTHCRHLVLLLSLLGFAGCTCWVNVSVAAFGSRNIRNVVGLLILCPPGGTGETPNSQPLSSPVRLFLQCRLSLSPGSPAPAAGGRAALSPPQGAGSTGQHCRYRGHMQVPGRTHCAGMAPHPVPHPALPVQPPALQLVEEFSTVLGLGSSRVSLQCKSRGVLPSPDPSPALAPWAGCPGVSTEHKKAATSDIYFLSPALLCLMLKHRKIISVSTEIPLINHVEQGKSCIVFSPQCWEAPEAPGVSFPPGAAGSVDAGTSRARAA